MKKRLYSIIFQHDAWEGKFFDLILIISIVLSVITVMLDSVQDISIHWGKQLYFAEWFFTILFSIEYLLRIYSVKEPKNYIFSFFGVIDLLSVVPSYLSFFFPGSQYLIVIRVMRVLRIFRVLKFVRYIGEENQLRRALGRSRHKITIFLFTVLTLIIIFGSLMYLIESETNTGFTSIPISIYWAIVTMTTVGYGDISPQTPLGQLLAALIMITGYSIIAVPGGIVTAAMVKSGKKNGQARGCPNCSLVEHDPDAEFCKRCGNKIILSGVDSQT